MILAMSVLKHLQTPLTRDSSVAGDVDPLTSRVPAHVRYEIREEVRQVPESLPGGPHRSWLERLVEEAGRAAQAGNAQTARLIALLAVGAAAVALVLWASR